ncbi:MAG: galactokinase [Phycisphaeraceae bacterium]|nr:galactokinase [Phycisphaeraceae bacterium]
MPPSQTPTPGSNPTPGSPGAPGSAPAPAPGSNAPKRSAAERITQLFQSRYGRPPTWIAAAPGRVNLIGEHTDYNDGFVLPMAIEQRTLMAGSLAEDGGRRIRVVSELSPEMASFELDVLSPPEGTPNWWEYPRGVAAGMIEKGAQARGLDLAVASDVPMGGGLSSSAALEVATATLLEAAWRHPLDAVEKALLCQRAEHRYARVPCGIMDQFISTMARPDHALLLDCRDLTTRQVPLRDPNITVLIANTNVRHELSGGEYAQRRAQCEQAARELGVSSLRDLDLNQVIRAKPGLDALIFKRAYHVVGEIQRTQRAAELLAAEDYEGFGRLMFDSHVTLRDDFQVSCDELDLMVELAEDRKGIGGVLGARMTGGGFGGCCVLLVRAQKAADIQRYLYTSYLERTRIEPEIFVTRAGAGAELPRAP